MIECIASCCISLLMVLRFMTLMRAGNSSASAIGVASNSLTSAAAGIAPSRNAGMGEQSRQLSSRIDAAWYLVWG